MANPYLHLYQSLPNDPGIYKMLDEEGIVLYVGKAKNLKKRVSSYFIGLDRKDLKTQILVSHIFKIETIVTPSERDALVLENQLIKNHQPKYNILLKDDKFYPFIKITMQDPFPRVLVTRQRQKDGAKYFGPYPSLGSTRHLQQLLLELFPIRDCKKPITLDSKQSKCINLDIGKCIGPCVFKHVKPEYDLYIQAAMDVLKGRNKSVIKQLNERMLYYSQTLQFEKAALVRDRIQKLKVLAEKQIVLLNTDETFLAVATAEVGETFYVFFQVFVEGKLLYQKGVYLDSGYGLKQDAISQALLKYWDELDLKFDRILCDEENKDAVETVVIAKEPSLWVECPLKGIKHDVLQMAAKNAKMSALRVEKDTQLKVKAPLEEGLSHLKTTLHLRKIPHRIMGFDISHLQGQDIVSSAVCFTAGRPDKSFYRQFKIRSVQDQSHDPQSIYETVLRRLSLCNEEDPLPDLLLIDGGKGQLNFAVRALQELGLEGQVDIVSLAKREELVFKPGEREPFRLNYHTKGLQILQSVRDESHRFALRMQRKQRPKRQLETILSQIKGLGEKRIRMLYNRYPTIALLKDETVPNLSKIGGMGPKLAKAILDYVQNIHY